MKRIYSICLVNMAWVFILAGIITVEANSSTSDFMAYAGLVSILWSVVCIFVGLALLLFRQKQWGQGFLLTAALLVLSGFTECSLSGMFS